MHTEPSRTSPSFGQVPENGKVDVIGHKLTPRVQHDEVSMPAPVKPRRCARSPSRNHRTPGSGRRLVRPRRNLPTIGWRFRCRKPTPANRQIRRRLSHPAAPPPVQVPMDDWNLVRTLDGKVGWVLTRPLSMAIPDEVAQYAEGHRITSYFPLGQVRDGDSVKNNWLWTTINKGGQPYEFDSFRVFVWSLRHHRYETAYIERNVVGHYPVQVTNAGSAPSFSVLIEGVDGHLYRKTYSFDSYRIRMVDRELDDQEPKSDAPKLASNARRRRRRIRPRKRSWYARLKDRVHRFLR